ELLLVVVLDALAERRDGGLAARVELQLSVDEDPRARRLAVDDHVGPGDVVVQEVRVVLRRTSRQRRGRDDRQAGLRHRLLRTAADFFAASTFCRAGFAGAFLPFPAFPFAAAG